MKAIVLTSDSKDGLYAITDSAIGRDVMPLFVPDGEWRAEARLAFRLVRLGKNVRPKFAMSYIDAMGVVLLIKPAAAQQPPSWLGIMDSAATTGQWLPLTDGNIKATVQWQGGAAEICANADECVPDALATVTQLATVKTGDIIMPNIAAIDVPLIPNTRVEALIDGLQCLKLKIK